MTTPTYHPGFPGGSCVLRRPDYNMERVARLRLLHEQFRAELDNLHNRGRSSHRLYYLTLILWYILEGAVADINVIRDELLTAQTTEQPESAAFNERAYRLAVVMVRDFVETGQYQSTMLPDLPVGSPV
jgi:hypothetical protein